ncbi:MAG: hypothetical protein PHH69_06970 [Candidatus Omnitrophica bacterium]|nr:hypothetical protein [Candidatus Omnitrophota bacterium]MDD5611248.1 hypothetical protein [Candidatus Omnitrophota bacterium]
MTEKARKEIIITSVLVLVLVFVGINTIAGIKKNKGSGAARAQSGVSPKHTAVPKPVKKSPTEIEKEKESLAMLEQEAESMKLKRDAFVHEQVASQEEITPSDLILCGIIWDEDSPIAIINGVIVRKGDKVGTSTVKDIEENFVLLNDGNKDYKINLNP